MVRARAAVALARSPRARANSWIALASRSGRRRVLAHGSSRLRIAPAEVPEALRVLLRCLAGVLARASPGYLLVQPVHEGNQTISGRACACQLALPVLGSADRQSYAPDGTNDQDTNQDNPSPDEQVDEERCGVHRSARRRLEMIRRRWGMVSHVGTLSPPKGSHDRGQHWLRSGAAEPW